MSTPNLGNPALLSIDAAILARTPLPNTMSREEIRRRHGNGIDALMWGTDYPHPEGSWPVTADQIKTTFGGLPEDDITKMLGATAAEFYGIDTEKLAPLVARIGPEKPCPGSDGTTTSNASAASPPWAGGSVKGPIMSMNSATEPM